MRHPVPFGKLAPILAATLTGVATGTAAPASLPENISSSTDSSAEQGQTSLDETFDWREWRLQQRKEAWDDITYRCNFRTYYLDRNQFDGSISEAWAAGGWAGLTTGYFLDHIALGFTGYTSQPLLGDDDTDGTLLLAPGQEGYSVLGEFYADIRVIENVNILVGRKEFDSPYINRNDTRMTPNTFEAVVMEGRAEIGDDGGKLKYVAGYFDRIKERNADDFVSMSVDAGATVERGVGVAGAVYTKGNFSIGAVDYYSADIINIGYFETKLEVPVHHDWKARFAAQYTDQSAIGSDELTGSNFTARQFGLKAELDIGDALFTTAVTSNSGDATVQNPWSGYPGYTSSQVQEFNRDGEAAFLVRAAYDFPAVKGLGVYAMGVFGTTPDAPGEYRQDEVDMNIQWAPPDGVLKGLALRVRYGIVEQYGSDAGTLTDFRVICNYAIQF